MAQILIDVKLNNVLAKSQLKELEKAIQGISQSLSNVKVNRNLTAQLNALTKNYNALAKAAQAAQKADNKAEIQKQKLAKASAEASRAIINEQKAKVQLQVATDKATKTTQQNTEATKQNTKSNLENRQSILSMAQGFFQWQVAARAVMIPLNLLRQAWQSLNQTLKETENTVIALQRILPSGSASDQDIANKLYDLAQKYGQTFENVSEIATNFARTGMSWNDTIKATEAGLLALNVAELDATAASDGMIAIMRQFGKEASELTGIIDILNKTADNYAVTTDKLLTALQRTGSSAANANLTLEETVGLITALSESTGRSGQNLGTAINSLIQYSSKSGSLDIFASLDERTSEVVGKYRKGAATILDVWQEVSRVINTMDERQESILSGLIDDDDIKNLETELQDELGDIFETVSDVYGTANTFRKNYFIALLGNMQTVNNAIKTAQDAQGYSQKENEKYLDTYTAKVNALQAQWKKLANDEQGFLSFKKTLVTIATQILKIVELFGGLRTVLLSIGTIVWALFGDKLLLQIKKIGTSIKTMFAELKAGAISLNSVLGVIGLIATAISIIQGVISKIKERTSVNQESNISNASETLSKLSDYLNEIEKEHDRIVSQVKDINKVISDEDSTTEQVANAQNSLLSIQQSLIENNKEYSKSIDLVNSSYEQQLKTLDDIEEYQRKKAVEEWIAKNKLDIDVAEGYLSETFDRINFTRDKSNPYEAIFGSTDFAKYLHSLGYSTDDRWDLSIGNFFSGLFGSEEFWTALNTDSLTREQQIKLLEELYEKAKTYDQENNTPFASIISAALQDINNETYKNAVELIRGNLQSSNWIEQLTQEQREKYVSGDYSWNDIKGILGIVDEIVDKTQTWAQQSAKVLSNYQDILDTINSMRNAEQSILDIEEKRQALEDARKNKNVRVFNAATGTWELQADEKAIAKAEKDYESAVWNNLQNEIKNGNLTVGEIYDKVAAISEDLPDLANMIRDVFIDAGYKVPAFDRGGVLHGLGGIKATNSNEIVLDPSITRQILQPTSNEQFSAFVKDLGLLFGVSKQVMNPTSGMVVNNGATNNNDNRTYTVNGIPFTAQDARSYSLAELFETAAQFNN